MNARDIAKLLPIVLICTYILTGCSNLGNVTIDGNKPEPHITKKERESSALSSRKAATAESIRALGPKMKFGLPFGPTWLHVYNQDNINVGKFNPDKHAIATLNAEGKASLAGKLPLVGMVSTNSFKVTSSQASIDDSNRIDGNLILTWFVDGNDHISLNFNTLANANLDKLSSMAFTDINKYLAASSTHDPSKLPNKSEKLLGNLKVDTSFAKDQYKYQIEEYYFDKNTVKANGSQNNGTFITIGTSSAASEEDSTVLNIAINVKAKETDINENKIRTANDVQYGETKTKIETYQLSYQLIPNDHWELIQVTGLGTSEYALDTTGSNWIVKK